MGLRIFDLITQLNFTMQIFAENRDLGGFLLASSSFAIISNPSSPTRNSFCPQLGYLTVFSVLSMLTFNQNEDCKALLLDFLELSYLGFD